MNPPLRLLLLAAAGLLALLPARGQTPPPPFQPPQIPLEEVPPLTDELRQAIAAAPPAEARVGVDANGAVRLQVDGGDHPLFIGGIKGFVPFDRMRVRVWKQAGCDVVLLYYDLAYMSSSIGWTNTKLGPYAHPFWSGPGTYDTDDLEKTLWRVLQVYPDARIILWPWIDSYPGWDAAHPDELVRNEAGQPFVIGSHFYRVQKDAADGPDPAKRERLAWSMFSDVFRREAGEALRRFVQATEASVPGRRVIGYVLGGGQDGQLYPWEAPNFVLADDASAWDDYSAPALRAWHAWLEKKYGTPEALSRAWRTPVASFDAAPPPKAASLVGGDLYHDPAAGCQPADWKRFLTEGRAGFVSSLAAVVKETAKRPCIVGASGGISSARYGLDGNGVLLRDPNIDLFFHQATYGNGLRLPPGVGGINTALASHALHRKLFMADMDQRTWLVPPANSESQKAFGVIRFSNDSTGQASNIGQLRAMWRRELGRLWQIGEGPMFHPLVKPETFEDPAIYEELKFLRATAASIPVPSPTQVAGDVAVIYDERASPWLRGGLSSRHFAWTEGQQTELNACGVPYRLYYADDLRDGLVPPAKMYLFCNAIDLDPALRRAVEGLKKDGALLVWTQDAGYVQRGAAPGTVAGTLGIGLTPLAAAPAKSAPGAVPGFPAGALAGQAFDHDPQAGWRVDDPRAAALACYPGTHEVAAALVDRGAWKAAFVGNPVVSRNLLHALAEAAGAWVPAPAGNVVTAGEGWIVVHPLQSGHLALRLRGEAALHALWPETLASPRALVHELDLQAGTTYFFKLDAGTAP